MLGPLLAMPSGQGLNMTILAILKVNRTNWLLVLEIKLELRKNVSTIDKISLLVRQHYGVIPLYSLNIWVFTFISFVSASCPIGERNGIRGPWPRQLWKATQDLGPRLSMQVPAERAVGLVYIILVSGELDWQCHWARWTLVFSDDEGSMCDYFPIVPWGSVTTNK